MPAYHGRARSRGVAEPVAPAVHRVVVAEVLDVDKHPERRPPVACARWMLANVRRCRSSAARPTWRPGMHVPCALVGRACCRATSRSSSAKVRGVESQGMLCSAKELGIADDAAAACCVLAADAPVGSDMRELSRSRRHRCSRIKLTPNRADCLCLLGVAREVAALTGAALQSPDVAPVAAQTATSVAAASSRAPDGCGRFIRPGDPQCQRRRADAGLDEAAPGALRPALDLGAGGRHQLRDAGTWPAAARLRPGQARTAASTCATAAHGRAAEAAERADRRAWTTTRAVITDELRAARPGRHHGRRLDQGDDRHAANVFLEAAFFLPEAIAGPARARYNFAQRRRASLRARRRLRQQRRRHRARDAN